MNQLESASTTITVGEGGLGPYLQFWQGIGAAAEQSHGACEATINDMTGRQWTAEPGQRAMELFAQARQAADEQVQLLEASRAVADAYVANPHTGDKDSVTNL